MSRVRKYKNKSNQIKFIIRTVVIVTMAICIIDLLVIAFPFYADKLPEGVSEKIDYASVVETDLVSTGMSIIGIAVAVWAGLNLIQVLEQKMFSELNEHVRQFEDERKSVYRKRFLVGLIHSDNSLDKYFYAKLASLKESDFEDVSLEIFYELCLFQEADFFARIDVKKNMSRGEYQYYTEKTDEIDQLLRAYADLNSGNRCMKVIKEYLISRKADIYFNIGYGVEGREKYQAFKKTIELYEYLYPELKSASWEEISTYNIGQIIGEETRTEVQIREGIINYCLHLLNTYAEAYSCLLFSMKDASWIEMGLTWIHGKNTIISMQKVFDCILRIFAENESADVNKNPDRKLLLRDEMKEFVYRNYGAFLERYYKAGFDVEGRDIKAIEHSVKCAKEKLNLNDEQTQKIFNLYVNAINTTLFSKDNMKARESSFYVLGSFWHKISEGKDILGVATQKKRYWNIKELSEMLEKVEYYMDIGCREFPLKYDLKLIRTLVYRDKALFKLIENRDEEAVSLYKRAKSRYETIRKFHGHELEQSNNKFYKTLKESIPELGTLFIQKKESTMINNSGKPSIDRPWMKYYKGKMEEAPSPECSMYEFLYQCNQSRLDFTALNYFGTKISYGKLFEKIDQTALALRAYGVKKGDIVSICGLNTPEAVYLLYAINKVGAVSNWIGLTSPVSDLSEQISSTESKIVFVVEPAFGKIMEAVKESQLEKVITMPMEYSMPGVLKLVAGLKKKRNAVKSDAATVSVIRWKEFFRKAGNGSESPEKAKMPGAEGISEARGGEMAMIEYTGGSTGVPKGVMLSNKNLNSYYVNFLKANSVGLTSYQRGESFLDCVPLFLAFGVSTCCHGPLSRSMELVLAPDPKPEAAVKQILKTKPNHIAAGRPLVDGLAEKTENTRKDLSYIHSIMYGGEGADRNWEKNTEERLQKNQMNAPIRNGYGMTETSAAILVAAKQDPTGLIPLGDVNVKIVDPDDPHTEYGYDTEGELCLSADTVMMGYFKKSQETEEVLFEENGARWIKTHDLAKISPDGIITITGRIKRIYYKLSSENVIIRVYPMRTEEAIAKDPEVERCAVVGIKDAKTAYRTVAYLKLRDGDALHRCDIVRERIDRLCREKLPESHVPDEYVFVEEFPLTRAGKVDYRELERMYVEKESER